MSEKKLSRFLPLYASVNSRPPHPLTFSGDIRHKGVSIYHYVHTIISWLGFGIAWGFDHDEDGKFYIETEHIMKWDRCTRGEVVSKTWIGRMEIFV